MQPAASGERSIAGSKPERRASASEPTPPRQIAPRAHRSPPSLRTHCKPRVPQRKSVCARLLHACMREVKRMEILPRARLRTSRAPMALVRSKDKLPSGRPKRSRSCSSCHSYGRQLRWRRGVREQASRGCPSARGCIALAPAPRRTPSCPNSRPQLMALAGGARIPPGQDAQLREHGQHRERGAHLFPSGASETLARTERPAQQQRPASHAGCETKHMARGRATGNLRPASMKPGSNPESVRHARYTAADAAQGKAGCTSRGQGCRRAAHAVKRRSQECPRACRGVRGPLLRILHSRGRVRL